MTHVPEGFQPHTRKSGFTAPWEPIYHRPHDNGISLGLHARDAHANSRGFVHGGLLSALCDNAMGLSCLPHLEDSTLPPLKGLVTVNLNLDFLGSARVDVHARDFVHGSGGGTHGSARPFWPFAGWLQEESLLHF